MPHRHRSGPPTRSRDAIDLLLEEYRAMYGLALFRVSSLERRVPVGGAALAAFLAAVLALSAAGQLVVLVAIPVSLLWLLRTTVHPQSQPMSRPLGGDSRPGRQILAGRVNWSGASSAMNGRWMERRVKDHPNDIDGYFVCEEPRLRSRSLQHDLNRIDPEKCWTWDPATRRPYRGYPKLQLPMWHAYRVELYPQCPGLIAGRDALGNELEFPAWFRQVRSTGEPKGIIKIVKP